MRTLRLLLLLAGSAAAAVEADPVPALDGTKERSVGVSVAGWSEDESVFAVRIYDTASEYDEWAEEQPPHCPGYVDHEGKPFRGGLSLVLHDVKGQRLGAWRIQDGSNCTPPARAKKNLERAKAALEKHNVRTSLTGTFLQPDPKARRSLPKRSADLTRTTTTVVTVDVPSGARAGWVLELTSTAVRRPDAHDHGEDADPTHVLRGRRGKEEVVLLERKAPRVHYELIMAGGWETGLHGIALSPSGRRVVIWAYSGFGNMRGSQSDVLLVGVVDLQGLPAKLKEAAPVLEPPK